MINDITYNCFLDKPKLCGTLLCSQSADRCVITKQAKSEDDYITVVTKCLAHGNYISISYSS